MPYGNPDLGSYRLCRLTKDIMPWSKDVQYQFLSSEDSVRGKVAMESAGLSAAASDTGLISFRICEDRGFAWPRKTLLRWRVMDVGPGLTFRQAFEALVEVMERDAAASSSGLADELGRLQERSLRCTVGGSTVASEESQSEVNLDFRVRDCQRFGSYVTYYVAQPESGASQKKKTVDAFSALMTGARTAALAWKLPEKHQEETGKRIRGDFKLENDIIDWLENLGLGFRNGGEKTVGKDLVHGLRSVLFQLTPARRERLRMRGCNIPELFCPLMQETYNDPTKHHHKELPPLSKSDVDEMASKLLELHCLPPLQTSKWKNVADGLASFASQLQKYSSYLSSTTERQKCAHNTNLC